MIKKFIIIFNLLFAFLAVPSKAAFDINARTAILQDFLSGEILFEKEIDSVISVSYTHLTLRRRG